MSLVLYIWFGFFLVTNLFFYATLKHSVKILTQEEFFKEFNSVYDYMIRTGKDVGERTIVVNTTMFLINVAIVPVFLIGAGLIYLFI